jgi:hypothetical protein
MPTLTNRLKHAGSASVTLMRCLPLLGCLIPLTAAAQVQPGQRVRIRSTAVDSLVVGTLTSITADTLVVQTTDGARPLGTRTVQRIDVSQGMGHAGGHGAKIGAFVGALAGALGGFVSHQECSAEGSCFFDEPVPEVLGAAVAGALAGAGAGFLIGATQRRERWKPAALDVAVTPARVQLSLRF